MKPTWLAPLAISGSLCFGQADPRTQYSVSVDLIKVPFTVFDQHDQMVQDLDRSDFRLYENGVPQEIRSFGRDLLPVSVVLVIDTSGSSEKEEKGLKKIKEAAESFVMALSKQDRVSIIAFSDEVELAQDWTHDRKRARKVIRKLMPGFRTALYDAIFMAAQDQLGELDGRKAIILLTDGLNNQSRVLAQEAALSVVQSQATLYVVSKTMILKEAARNQRRVIMLQEIYEKNFGEDNYIERFFLKREAEMRGLAERTGGRAFFPVSYDRIKDVYREVARELKHQYYLTYVSNQTKVPKSYYQISLDYLPPTSRLNYRRGYYFKPDPIRVRGSM